mmetsp:Transcript_104261/g.304365  ORF Transcript_104261/g.304365 Transcript_104261/m.304365 type:complete len:227 (-) Transcript_104261:102-782(-)
MALFHMAAVRNPVPHTLHGWQSSLHTWQHSAPPCTDCQTSPAKKETSPRLPALGPQRESRQQVSARSLGPRAAPSPWPHPPRPCGVRTERARGPSPAGCPSRAPPPVAHQGHGGGSPSACPALPHVVPLQLVQHQLLLTLKLGGKHRLRPERVHAEQPQGNAQKPQGQRDHRRPGPPRRLLGQQPVTQVSNCRIGGAEHHPGSWASVGGANAARGIHAAAATLRFG